MPVRFVVMPIESKQSQPRVWKLAHERFLVLDRPRVMAILNVTPDSFFDASRVTGIEASVNRASEAVQAGADILDIGGESTRPGAQAVSDADQINRVVPIIAAIRKQPGDLGEIPISVDTTKPDVAAAAIDAGADAINDVSGATDGPGMIDLAARNGAGLVLMHRLAPPARDSYSDRYEEAPSYQDVVSDVRGFLKSQSEAAVQAGISVAQIVLDPGLGFGKSVEQNLELIRQTGELGSLGYPILSAASRKSFVGRCSFPEIETTDPGDRLSGSIAFSTLHWMLGASIFRVHDVAEQVQALRAAWAIQPFPMKHVATSESGPA